MADGRILSNVVASQAAHRAFGGVVPELASREHLSAIDTSVTRALGDARLTLGEVGVIAATRGPGLAGALLVGLTYAQGISLGHGIPMYAVHHLEGHIQAALADDPALEPPFLALVVSGGHTHLFDVPARGEYRKVGATRDDAAGEALDKVARLLGLGFPGGPAIARLAEHGDSYALPWGLPLRGQDGFDFSFSGLKNAARLAVQSDDWNAADIAASFERIVVESLVTTTVRAAQALGRETLVVSGGVAASLALRRAFAATGRRMLFPPPGLNTDNGAMIALAGLVRARRGDVPDGLGASARAHLPLAP